MKKVTPKQFKEFIDETLRGIRGRGGKHEREYEGVLMKLLACGLVNKSAIKGAESLVVATAEPFQGSVIVRIETSNRLNTLTIIPSTGGYHCSCMKKESQKVCKDILAYLREVLGKRTANKYLYAKTIKWLDKLIDKR